MVRLSSMIRPTLLALGLVASLGMVELQEHQQEHQDVRAQIESNPLRSVKLSSEQLEKQGYTRKSIGVYSIFMGSYDVFFPDFLENMRTYFLPEHSKRFFIVTDKQDFCDNLLATEADVECSVKENVGWPYESLYRWNYFKTSFTPSPAISHIFFLNANSRCVDTVNDDILGSHVAVQHNMFIGSAYDQMSFEKNPISTAYVPPEDHFKYFGARFLGATTENFLKMCDVLDRNTQIDESNHFIAAWHDESHYNHYINVVLDQQGVKMLGPEYHVPEELIGTDGVDVAKGTAKVIYLDKKRLPDFEAAKSRIWQKTIGGDVHFHSSPLDLPAFRACVYRALNPQLKAFSDEELRIHYLAHPETPYFYETAVFAALFDAAKYMKLYGLGSELIAKYHYIRIGAWSEDHTFPVRGSNVDDEVFLSYWWQKGDRLERDLTHRRKLGVSLYAGTPKPTPSPTQPPTAAPNPNFNAAAQNYVCEPEVPLNNNGAGGRTLAATTTSNQVTIKLANDSASECYSACYNKLAPDNQAFVFNLYPVDGSTVCTCCKQCAQWRPVPGAVIYSSCNHVALKVVSKTDKVHRFMSYKFKTSVTNKQTINLVNIGVTIQLDNSTGKVKTLAWPIRKYLKNPVTNGTTITWPVVPLKAGKKQGFGVKVYVKKGTSNKTLVFTVSTFQTFVTPSGSKENICYNTRSLSANYYARWAG